MRPRYIPDKSQQKLRKLVRYRKNLVGEHTRELNRLQKALERANIKLFGIVSDINSRRAHSILEFVLTSKSLVSVRYDEMYEKNTIAHNLKITKEQISDDLNCAMSLFQHQTMKEPPCYLGELNILSEILITRLISSYMCYSFFIRTDKY